MRTISNKKKLKSESNLPVEVMIEIESRCNFNCKFCFNKSSFAKKGRNLKELPTNYIKKIIDNIDEIGIKVVRFTGGEPLLRKDIFELLKYAKSKKLEVRLNTNGSLITRDIAKKMQNLVDNILIPIESCDNKIEEKITGHPKSLLKKIKSIGNLKKAGIPVIRVGTVAIKENIENFKKISDLILQLRVSEWEWYRPISSGKKSNYITSRHLDYLVEKILKTQKKTNTILSVANAIPFCAVGNSEKINSISSGALYDDGHSRLVVDPRGFIKPHYFIDKNIGDPLDILGAWNHPFMKNMRNLKYLPKKCEKCNYKSKCRGGSRHEARAIFGSWKAPDPLAAFESMKNKQ